MKSFGRFVAITLSCLFLGLLALHGAANMIESRDLEAQLESLRKRGEPVTLKEIAPPPVPDEENAALVYEKAFPRLSRKPTTAAQREQRADDDRDLTDFVSANPEERGRVPVDRVRRILAGQQDTLALARQAAAMPRCRFPINYEAGAAALFPHLPLLRQIARLLSADAQVEAIDGHADAAVADIEASVAMAHQIGQEPILISQLVQYAVLALATNALNRVLEAASPGAAVADRLYSRLAAYDVYRSYVAALLGERAFGLWCYDLVQRDPAQAAAVLRSGDVPGSPPSPAVPGLGLAVSPLIKKDEVYYLEWMRRAIDRAKERQASTPEARMAEVQFPPYAMLTRIIAPALAQAEAKRDGAAARLGLAQWALVLDLYRQQAGAYPASLDPVKRSTSWPLPDDPFTHQEFRYRPEGGGYLLYSAGPNARDDGGIGSVDRPRRGPEITGEISGAGAATEAPAGERPDDIAWRISSP